MDVLASIYTRVGRLADGLYYGKLAVCLKPRPDAKDLVPADLSSYMTSLQNVGISHHLTKAEAAFHLGLFREALDQAEKHLRIHPGDKASMLLIARSLLALDRPFAAASMMRAALHHNPADPRMHAVLADSMMACGRHDTAIEHQKIAFELAGDDDTLRAEVAGSLVLQSGANWPAAQAMIDAFVAEREAPLRRVNARDKVDSPVVGLMWDQVYDSPLAHCVAPVLKHFEMTVLYTLNPRHDPVTDLLRTSVMRPRQSIGIDAATLGRVVLGDQPGVLINLCCPSERASYPVFKGDGAPATLHWISSPMCDRLPGVSVVLSDEETAPVDRRTYGEERVMSLPNLLAFQFPKILAPEEEVLDLPRSTRGFPMFGVHGHGARMTGESVALWSRVLWAVPDAHLMIGGRDDWEEEMVTWGLEAFAEYGVSNRVHFQAPLEDNAAAAAKAFPHMVDVVLDSTPVNGLTELAWDLWMGLPVVSMRGDRRAGRMGASILRAAGRPEWIADDSAGYVAIAARLAKDPDLARIRAELRQQVLASRLANPDALGDEISVRLKGIRTLDLSRG
ncbi:O-linked N-acetylglucosamine transferase [Magnetospirillum sp. ME-1]|nr:O-linked N-acetylglucosamine transferase [Magnetospirillum sp. ME-1]